MSINLQKGQKIDLTKKGEGLKELMVGLGWDEAEPEKKKGLAGLFGGGQKPATIDCDASVILLNANGKLWGNDVKDHLVCFNTLVHPSGAIVHQGDNLTGEGEGDDEQIMIDLSRIPEDVARLVFIVNIYDAGKKGQHFGMIRNAFIRLLDLKKREEICRFNLTEDYSGMQGMIAGEIYRRNGEWRFNAVGQPVIEASRLSSFLNMYK